MLYPGVTDRSRSDVWAIGVITYFLLCGYTPFDRDSNLEEMQAILVADYSFTPLEYWRGISKAAREFIKRCLTIDPTMRMTAHDALLHPWIADEGMSGGRQEDLLPNVKKNFNARRTLHAAIDTIRAINQLRAGGATGMMDGATSKDPDRVGNALASAPGGEAMDGIQATGAGELLPKVMDTGGNGRGQTQEQIREQERRVRETQQGFWG